MERFLPNQKKSDNINKKHPVVGCEWGWWFNFYLVFLLKFCYQTLEQTTKWFDPTPTAFDFGSCFPRLNSVNCSRKASEGSAMQHIVHQTAQRRASLHSTSGAERRDSRLWDQAGVKITNIWNHHLGTLNTPSNKGKIQSPNKTHSTGSSGLTIGSHGVTTCQ